MTGLHNLLRRWEIERYESKRAHFARSGLRTEVMLGAYGLTASGAPLASDRRAH